MPSIVGDWLAASVTYGSGCPEVVIVPVIAGIKKHVRMNIRASTQVTMVSSALLLLLFMFVVVVAYVCCCC